MFGPEFYRLDFPSDISLGVFRRPSIGLAASEDNTIRMFALLGFSHLSVKSIKAGENWTSPAG